MITGTALGVVLAAGSLAYEETTERTFDLGDTKRLRIELRDANAVFVGEDRSDIRVVIESRLPKASEEAGKRLLAEWPVEFSESGEALRILETRKPGYNHRGYERLERTVRIQAPRSMILSLRIEDGDTQVSGLAGDLDADVEDGDFTGSGLGGAVALKMEDGDVELSGSMKNVSVKIEDGDLEVVCDETPRGQMDLDIEDGDLLLKLPPNAAATVSLQIEDGTAIIGDVGDSQLVASSGNGKKRVVALNGGGVAINLRVEDGDVTVN